MPPPQSVNEVKAAIAAAARSDGSLRIVQQQQQPQRRAGFAGGEGVEGQAGAMVICSRWGMEVDFRCAPRFRSAVDAGGAQTTTNHCIVIISTF